MNHPVSIGYRSERASGHVETLGNNVRQLIVNIQMYQEDNGKYPNKATIWQDVSFPPKALICPTYGMKKDIAYGYNASLSGKTLKVSDIPQPQNLPVLADSKTPNHLLTSTADIDFRHTGKAVVGFADGHVILLPLTDIPTLQPDNKSTEQNQP